MPGSRAAWNRTTFFDLVEEYLFFVRSGRGMAGVSAECLGHLLCDVEVLVFVDGFDELWREFWVDC